MIAHPPLQHEQALALPLVALGVARRVVAHEHLGIRGIEALQGRAEAVVTVLELDDRTPAHLHRHGGRDAQLVGSGNDAGAVLLVDEHGRSAGGDAAIGGQHHGVEDHGLGPHATLVIARRRLAGDPEE